jgi:hypothetical protein
VRSNVLIPLILLVSGCSARATTSPADTTSPVTGPDYDPNVISVPFLVGRSLHPERLHG